MKELEESAAFARGADFLSECLVLFVGSSLLTIEVTRSNKAAAEKERKKNAERKQFYDVRKSMSRKMVLTWSFVMYVWIAGNA